MLILFRLLILVTQFKKTDSDTKISEIEKKVTDHYHSNKYITTQNLIIQQQKILKQDKDK